jgi:hypothetical protein
MSISLILFLVTLLVCRHSVSVPTDVLDVAAMQAIASLPARTSCSAGGVKSADPCDGTWSGVYCNNPGHVTAISFERAGLVDLRFLTELDFSYNSLGGDLPVLPRPHNLL